MMTIKFFVYPSFEKRLEEWDDETKNISKIIFENQPLLG